MQTSTIHDNLHIIPVKYNTYKLVLTVQHNSIIVSTSELSKSINDNIRTSKIAYKIFKFHFSLRLNVLVMEIGVEHDDSKGKQEYRISTSEPAHYIWVTFAVTTGECLQIVVYS